MHKTKVSHQHENDQKPKKRQERKRYLNVIYFIDSKRTRTLKFGIGMSYFTVGAISLAVIWSVVATSLLIRDRFVIAEMSSHSQSLLDTVFNYQTRYDEVYEKAYPQAEVETDSVAEEAPSADEPTTTKIADYSSKTKRSANAEPATSVLPIHQGAIAKDKAAPDKLIEGVPISIDNFASTLMGKSLTVRLSLKNLVSPQRSAGSLSGVVKFVDINNETHTIVGRPSRSGGSEEHFTIRYFTNKNLIFESPNGLAGKFASVTVTIKDDQAQTKDFTYSVNKEIPASAPNPLPIAAPKPEAAPQVSKAQEAPEAQTVPVNDEAPSDESTDSIDTSVTSGATDTTTDSID